MAEPLEPGVADGAPTPRRSVACCQHGVQDIALMCVHAATAIDSREPVGFFVGDDTDTGRPDAWCLACERALRALNGASSAQWFRDADFKILCVACWDEGKRMLHDEAPVAAAAPVRDGWLKRLAARLGRRAR